MESDGDSGACSSAFGNSSQEIMKKNFKKEDEKEQSKINHQQETEEQKHNIMFCFSGDTDSVHLPDTSTSMTVLDALYRSDTFRMNKNVIDTKKEIVILRADGAAVKTEFPCCLIEKDEILTIHFIKKDEKASSEQDAPARLSFSRPNLVSFYIKTTGKEKIIYAMKNNELRNTCEYVCVYAFQKETVEDALKRDGRFNDKIFQKLCVLSLDSRSKAKKGQYNRRYEMSNPVEDLKNKTFQIIVTGDKQPERLKKQFTHNQIEGQDKAGSDLTSDADPAKYDPGQHPTTTKETVHDKESTNYLTRRTIAEIPDSKEILQFLRDQYKGLLKTLKERENLKNNSEVQTFLRAKYDKSVQSFSEVYKVKQLMGFSESVCQIQVDGFGKGTAFLLFGRYILTNAHVVKDLLVSKDRLTCYKNIMAAFDFERLDSKMKLVSFKQEIPAYCYLTDANQNRLDFALLELDSADEIKGRPELLKYYCPGLLPNSGGICIVGHPEGGIKRMDPCYIIGKENLKEAADKHINEFLQVITQRNFDDTIKIYENQISYDSCFFEGSSGSPVFDKDCYLIGIHTGGYVYPPKEGRKFKEYAYSMQPVLDMIRAQAKIKGLQEIVDVLEQCRYHQDVEMKDV